MRIAFLQHWAAPLPSELCKIVCRDHAAAAVVTLAAAAAVAAAVAGVATPRRRRRPLSPAPLGPRAVWVSGPFWTRAHSGPGLICNHVGQSGCGPSPNFGAGPGNLMIQSLMTPNRISTGSPKQQTSFIYLGRIIQKGFKTLFWDPGFCPGDSFDVEFALTWRGPALPP